jgi:hypothetical protein
VSYLAEAPRRLPDDLVSAFSHMVLTGHSAACAGHRRQGAGAIGAVRGDAKLSQISALQFHLPVWISSGKFLSRRFLSRRFLAEARWPGTFGANRLAWK